MGGWNILKKFGVWTTVLRWREPFAYRIRLKGDALVRLGIALAVGLVATAGFLFVFAAQANPDPAGNALFGMLVAAPATAVFLFLGTGNTSGQVRVCEEGIVRTRQSNALGHMRFEELSWPYDAIGQATLVPGQSIGKSFSLLFLSSPGSWEMIGVPRRISLEQLASHFSARGIPVLYADVVPEEFTRGMSWAWALASLGVSLPVIIAGMITYNQKAPLAGANVAAANRPPLPPRFAPPPPPRRQPAIPDPRDFVQPPPKAPDAPVGGEPAPDHPPLAPPNFAGPRGGRGPQGFGPPGMGPRFGPGSRQLPPSFAGRRGARQPEFEDGERRKPATPTAEQGEQKKGVEAMPPAAENQTARIANTFAPAPPRKTGPPQYNVPPWLPGEPTNLAGGPEGFQFEHCDRGRKTVVGFRYRMGRWGNQAAVADLIPVYDRNQFAGVKDRLVAREGYVVGGVQVVSGDLVNAVRVIFVREQDDGALDKSDHYLSDWIGESGEATPKALGDGQSRVIGVCGRRGAVLNALALVLDEE